MQATEGRTGRASQAPRSGVGAGRRRLANLVPVRFGSHHVNQSFDAGELVVRPGDELVVDTDKGPLIGRAGGYAARTMVATADLRRVIRKATDEDRAASQRASALADETSRICIQRIRALRLDMKLVLVEVPLDQSRVVVFFTSEDRVDFRGLVRDMSTRVRVRIEMRQIGVREGAGVIGGLGPCGNELCCSSFLKDFESISVRFAKQQGISLNPQKVTGMCGRLKCCLVYESSAYKEMKKFAPKKGVGVLTRQGHASVDDVDLLRLRLRLVYPTGASEWVHMRDVVVLDRRLEASEMESRLTREQEVLQKRLQRRGGVVDAGSMRGREVGLPADPDPHWSREREANAGVDESAEGGEAGGPGEAKKKRRKRKKRGDGASAGEGAQAEARVGEEPRGEGEVAGGRPRGDAGRPAVAGGRPGGAPGGGGGRGERPDPARGPHPERSSAPRPPPPRVTPPLRDDEDDRPGEDGDEGGDDEPMQSDEAGSAAPRRKRRRRSRRRSGGGESGGGEGSGGGDGSGGQSGGGSSAPTGGGSVEGA